MVRALPSVQVLQQDLYTATRRQCYGACVSAFAGCLRLSQPWSLVLMHRTDIQQVCYGRVWPGCIRDAAGLPSQHCQLIVSRGTSTGMYPSGPGICSTALTAAPSISCQMGGGALHVGGYSRPCPVRSFGIAMKPRMEARLARS